MKFSKKRKFVAIGLLGLLSLLWLIAVKPAEARQTQILTAEKIRQGTLEYLKNRISLEKDSMELEVLYQGKDLILPKGKLTLDYGDPGIKMGRGRIPVILKIRVNNILKRRLRINVQVIFSYSVVKTRRPIKRGHTIVEDDVWVGKVKSARTPKRVATRLEDVVGFELKRNLETGQFLPLNSLSRPFLVKKGDRIILVAEKGPMRITAPGIVRKRGYKDAIVEVLNLQTKKTVFGQLVDSKTVRVNY